MGLDSFACANLMGGSCITVFFLIKKQDVIGRWLVFAEKLEETTRGNKKPQARYRAGKLDRAKRIYSSSAASSPSMLKYFKVYVPLESATTRSQSRSWFFFKNFLVKYLR